MLAVRAREAVSSIAEGLAPMIVSICRAMGLHMTLLKTAVTLGFLGMLLSASGQQPLQTLLVGVDHRNVTNLDGDWHYLVDQSPGRALYTSSGQINARSYALNQHPNIVGRHNQEYDFSTAPTIKIPGDWNTHGPHLFTYEV